MNRIQNLRRERALARKAVLDRAFARLSDAAMRFGLKIVPFGSYAEGRVHGASDLDVAVRGSVALDGRRRIIREAQKIQADSGIGVDLVFEAESPEFFRKVLHAHQVR